MLVTTSPLVKTYTLDEFWELPEPEGRYKLELIRGVLFMVPPPDEKIHDPVVSCLNRLIIRELIRLGEPGQIFFPRSGIWTYYPDTWLEPDLFYLSRESLSRFKGKPRSSADLVVEVLSPGSADHDRLTKADSYAALEVKELWLVDPGRRTVEVRLNEGKRWKEAYRYGEDEEIPCRVIPGLRIAVADIFEEI
ncbi:MAG: Uma2 family endonuclease [Nitrospinae bacterium]|nr:Uma2 family endonuclease [Nitrospinota bacterium]